MELTTAHGLVDKVGGIDPAVADRDILTTGIGDVRRLIGWARSIELSLMRALAGLSSFPEKDFADAARTGLADGSRVLERAETTAAMPELGAALADGDIGVEHVDAANRARRRLDPALRAELDSRSSELAAQAKVMTPDEFAEALNRRARRLEEDAGVDRLRRQRGNNSVKTWVDQVSGMWNIRGSFDPVTGARLAQRLNDALNTRMTQPTPENCPADAVARMDWLRAAALTDLLHNVTGANSGSGASILVVVDATDVATADNDGRPIVDWGIPVEIPGRILRDLYGHPDTTVDVIIVRNEIVLHAPGQLDLGRSTRLANRAQRRVLRALYATCAIPGCSTHFNLCAIHHVTWWERGGLTDLVNLLPMCSKHHHNVHDKGWELALAVDRTLTVRLPDGDIMTTGPPRRRAA